MDRLDKEPRLARELAQREGCRSSHDEDNLRSVRLPRHVVEMEELNPRDLPTAGVNGIVGQPRGCDYKERNDVFRDDMRSMTEVGA